MTGADIPGDVSGGNPLVPWLNKLKRAVRRRTIVPGLGYKIHQREDGFALDIIPGTGGTPATAQIKRFFIVGISASSYLTCREWDGNTLPPGNGTTGPDVLIAKHHHMKASLTSEVIDGVTFNYTYSDANNRISNDGTTTQQEVAYPRYKIGDAVFAVRSENGTGEHAGGANEWTELTPRVWARRYSQS